MHNKHRNDACRAENTLVVNENGKRFFDTGLNYARTWNKRAWQFIVLCELYYVCCIL